MKKRLFLSAVLLLLTVTLFGQAEPAFAQENVLPNGSFEQPYNGGVADGWSPWHQDSNEKKDCNTETYFVRPSWSPEQNGALVFDGGTSMHIGNQFDTWRAGVFQTVNVEPGQTYRFSAYLRGRGSNEQYPNPSDGSVNMRGRVGVDPTGGGVWTSGSIVWSGTVSPHDSWQQAVVEVAATGSQVTVFVEGNFGGPNNCRRHLDMWFDKAELVKTGAAAAAAPTAVPQAQAPAPVVQAAPPATATPTIVPTATPIPTDTPIPSPTPTATPAGGTICINAFSDTNANGLNDPDEGYMAGVRFSIGQGNQLVSEGVSSGTNNPICFENLVVGTYQVAQVLPDTLEMTTAGNIAIDITQGRNVSLEFGSRIKQLEASQPVVINTGAQPTAVSAVVDNDGNSAAPAVTGAQTDGGFGGFGLWEIAAMIIMGIAVLLLLLVVVLLLRQQRRT